MTKKPKCSTNDDLIFGDLRSVDSDVEICNNPEDEEEVFDYDIRDTDERNK